MTNWSRLSRRAQLVNLWPQGSWQQPFKAMRCFCTLGMEVEINICLQGIQSAASYTLSHFMYQMYSVGVTQQALIVDCTSKCDVSKPICASVALAKKLPGEVIPHCCQHS